MRRHLPTARLLAAAGAVAAAAILHQKRNTNKKKRDQQAQRGRSETSYVPAQPREANDDSSLPEQPAAIEAQESSPLVSWESIKLDAKPVLCLEIEAAADEVAPEADPASTAALRLLDLLVSLAVLLICLVAGDLSADAYTAGLLLAAVLAAFAAAGLRDHALGSVTQDSPLSLQLPDIARTWSQLQRGLEDLQHKVYWRIQLEATGLVLAVTYWSLIAAQACATRLTQLRSRAAEYSAAAACARFLHCMKAIAHLNNSSSNDDAPDGPNVASEAALEQPASAQPGPAATALSPLKAVTGFFSCLSAIAALADDGDDDGRPPAFSGAQLQQTLPAEAVRGHSLASLLAAGGQYLWAPVTVTRGFVTCLMAIASLEVDERCTSADDDQQQQQSSGFMGSSETTCSKWVPVTVQPPVKRSSSFIHCMEAVARLGAVSE